MSLPTESVDRFGDRWMRIVWRKPATNIAERTRRRITVHLLPFLFLLYILAYLDRGNISVAALKMKLPTEAQGLGFTDEIIGFGSGLFFWGYWILEIPSTISVARFGARWVFARILILWGIAAATCGLIGMPLMQHALGWLPHGSPDGAGVWGAISNYVAQLPTNATYQFYFFRFLLGFFEGGFFPTVIVYLSYWFRGADRAKAIACFMVAIPFSSVVGTPLSGLLLDANWFGLSGWRWVFLLEGIAPVFAGIATLFCLPNRPESATWLPDDERRWLSGELEAEHRAKQGQSHWAWLHHAGMVVLLTMVYFGLNVSSYGLLFFLPSIIKSLTGAGDVAVTFIVGFYFLVAAAAMLFNGWHSDHTQERIWHVCLPLATQSVSLVLVFCLYNVPVVPVVILMVLIAATHYSHLPAFWPIPTIFLGALAAASAIGFVNMLGNLGGSVGGIIVGAAKNAESVYATGMLYMAPFPMMSAIIILLVGYFRKRVPVRQE